MAEAQFMVHAFVANIKRDEDGKPIGFHHHTEPDYRNPFPLSEEGWAVFLSRMTERYSKAVERSPDLADHLEMLTRFDQVVRESVSAQDPLRAA